MSRHSHRRRSWKHRIKRFLFGSGRSRGQHDTIETRDAVRAAVILGIAAVLVLLAVTWIRRWEDERYTVANVPVETPSDSTKPKELLVNGTLYRQKNLADTYLFMGIDVSGEAIPIDNYIGGGQSDVVMLVSVDHDKKTWQLLQLNRDTMTEVPVLGPDGRVERRDFQQLALAHAYGNGGVQSCANVVETVSSMMKGERIDGYFAMNLDGIAILNDAVGGVPVTITSDFSQVDDSLPMGETVTLTGKQAETFVRGRKGVDDQTNIARMARQKTYLISFFQCLKNQSEETILRAYEAVSPYTVTNMGSGTVSRLAEILREYQMLDVLGVEGEARVENNLWAFYPDENSLQQVMLALFYDPAES